MISIIIPVFNKGNELTRCIESLRQQTERDIEFILVDDGSTDGSEKLCDTACSMDLRFRVIHKANGGLSDARNTGVKAARGEFISFIDADDYVDKDYASSLLSVAIRQHADIVCMPLLVEKCGKPRRAEVPPISTDAARECSKKEALLELLYGRDIGISACGKLYSSELARRIEFPVGKLYEDVCYSCEAIIRAERISLLKVPQYHYVMNKSSITHKTDERVFDRFAIAMDAKRMIDRLGDEALSCAATRYAAYHGLSVLRSNYARNEITEYKEDKIINFIKDNKTSLMKNKSVPLRDKAAVQLLEGLGLSGYRLAWKAYATISGA